MKLDINTVVKEIVTELDNAGYEVDKMKYVDHRPEKKLSPENLAGKKFGYAEIYTRYHVYHIHLVTAEKEDGKGEKGETIKTELNCTAQLRQLIEGENDDRRTQLSFGHAPGKGEELKKLIAGILEHEHKLKKENPKFSKYWANY
jgi:hypothetical protein